VVIRRLQAERRIESVRRPKTGVPPTELRNQAYEISTQIYDFTSVKSPKFDLEFRPQSPLCRPCFKM